MIDDLRIEPCLGFMPGVFWYRSRHGSFGYLQHYVGGPFVESPKWCRACQIWFMLWSWRDGCSLHCNIGAQAFLGCSGDSWSDSGCCGGQKTRLYRKLRCMASHEKDIGYCTPQLFTMHAQPKTIQNISSSPVGFAVRQTDRLEAENPKSRECRTGSFHWWGWAAISCGMHDMDDRSIQSPYMATGLATSSSESSACRCRGYYIPLCWMESSWLSKLH